MRGGFDWTLTFKWKPVPHHNADTTAPVLSPTMAGGLFSIHRNFFNKLGTYDLQMNIWGAENLELSWRIWQCGYVETLYGILFPCG